MIKITIVERERISKTLRALAEDRSLYTDMILEAYGYGVDEAFRTQGFRTWDALRPSTKRARRQGWGKHYSQPSNSATYLYPANTWTAKMRDFVAGRTTGRNPLRFGRGTQNISIRGGPAYMGWAMRDTGWGRPFNETVLKKIVGIMEERITRGIIRNVEIAVK